MKKKRRKGEGHRRAGGGGGGDIEGKKNKMENGWEEAGNKKGIFKGGNK